MLNTGAFKILDTTSNKTFSYNSDNQFEQDYYTLSVQDYGNYGNLVITNSNQKFVWSAISNNLVSFESENPRSILPVEHYLLSSNGKYRLEMQNNGELAIYSNRGDNNVIWISPNSEGPAKQAQIRNDGTLVISKDCGPIWTSKKSTTGTAPFTLTLRDDGNLVIEDSNMNLIWESKSSKTKKYFP